MADGGADRFRSYVSACQLGRGFVVDPVADAARELGAEYLRASAAFGAETLSTDLQEDVSGAVELGKADGLGDHFLVLLGRYEEEFGHVVHDQEAGDGAFVLGQLPRCPR